MTPKVMCRKIFNFLILSVAIDYFAIGAESWRVITTYYEFIFNDRRVRDHILAKVAEKLGKVPKMVEKKLEI